MKSVDILSEINENSRVDLNFKLLDSLERKILELPQHRFSTLYKLKIGDLEMDYAISLSREFMEELKAGQHENDFDWIMLLSEDVKEHLRRIEKLLYRELRLKKLLK
ncbi:MAG: hypothetical protein SLAVMIC_00123 [uncultured marine phage]|uniref:Uncharacterized protein n=1 Tax=uncultured marine phage TaxID=707152 RepID=A0A8D9C8D9_9VIRU|nr:MAG: hypothetical protein SLAVMIC_00123 [uncultured marine phage]